LYTAPFAAGNFQATAASGSITGSAGVNVALLKGDLDGNGQRDIADVSGLTGTLADLDAYQSAHTFSGNDLRAIADVDGDLAVTNLDIQSLIVLLANAASGGGGAASPAAGDSTTSGSP